MKRLVALLSLSTLFYASRANAVALFGGDKPVQVREDFVLLHFDEAAKRVHVLYAARISPASSRIVIGLPTASKPEIEKMSSVDIGRDFRSLVAPRLMREDRPRTAPPAPWLTGNADLSAFVIDKGSKDQVFDVDWVKHYVDKGFVIAAIEVKTDVDNRVEVMTPAAHISFASETLVLPRREPSLPSANDPPPDDPDKPVESAVFSVNKVEPRRAGLANETVQKALQDPIRPLVDCYERFLEQVPGESAELGFDMVVRPSGEVATVRFTARAADQATKRLRACAEQHLQAKKMPRADEGYELTAKLNFSPPRTASRRTHVITIGSSRYSWRDMPASVRVEEDFEVPMEDVTRALSAEVRKAIGLRSEGRVWVTHWLDRDVRRTMASDVEFVRQDLPKLGEPGALAPPEPKPEADPHGWKRAEVKAPGQRHARKSRRTTAALSAVAALVLLALWIARTEARG